MKDEIGNRFDRTTSCFDQKDKRFEESRESIKNKNNQRPAGLQLQAQQPRLAGKADVFQDKKIRDRKEGVASYKRCGDISSVRVDGPLSQTNFDEEDITEPSALTKCIDDPLVDEGAGAPKLWSLTRKNAYVYTRRGLTAHRLSLYIAEDPLSPTGFSLELLCKDRKERQWYDNLPEKLQ